MNFEHHFPDVRKMVPRRLSADHFVGVSKMVLARHSTLNNEATVAENVVEFLKV